jgi:hypothetical protein
MAAVERTTIDDFAELSEDEFVELFCCTRAQFIEMPLWKQQALVRANKASNTEGLSHAAESISATDGAAQAGALRPADQGPRGILPLMRQRSRSRSLGGAPASVAAPELCAAELAACAAARKAKEFELCLTSARAALHKDRACGKAWAFLCWALFEMRKYDEARLECLRALSHRDWPLRDRAGMVTLRNSCRLISGLTPAVGDRLRDEWYRKELRALYEAGSLLEYETESFGGRWADEDKRKGVGRDELSLLDHVPAAGLRDVRLGGDGGERNVPEGLLEGGDSSNQRKPLQACSRGDRFPLEQALGGVVYLKRDILAFHCDARFGPAMDGADSNRRNCYNGNGPCFRCIVDGFPQPTHRFPAWGPVPPPGVTLHTPHTEMDVIYSTDAVPPRLHRQLTSVLDVLGKARPHCPMPQYHNIIDPNLNVGAEGLWVPTEFDIYRVPLTPVDVAVLVELACLSATGERLPFGFGHLIATLASDGQTRGESTLRSPIPDLDPHEHVKLHVATQNLMTCALPLLGRLRRPALLLPGPLQAVVKAQRIVLDDGEEYAGVWHEDGTEEHIVAAVLYYYRVSSSLRGGNLEFCSKQKQALWSGDAGGAHGDAEAAAELASALPRCQIPVTEGTLVCFSNYAAVHRVLRMEAEGGGGSRDFMAFFVVDQRHPLPTPTELAPLDERMRGSRARLVRQLQPHGSFGLDSSSVYSTGNGSVADVGWMARGGDGGGNMGRAYPETVSLISRLNLAPPRIERGLSAMLEAPQPVQDPVRHFMGDEQPLVYNPESSWVEAWVGEERGAEPQTVLYLDTSFGQPLTLIPPVAQGVSEVRSFPGGFGEFGSYCDAEGFFTHDAVLEALMAGKAIALLVPGAPASYVTKAQLRPVKLLQGIAEGMRCELVPLLKEADEAAELDEHEEAFEEGRFVRNWPAVYEFLLRPERPLAPLAQFRGASQYYRGRFRSAWRSEIFEIQVSALHLGFRALWKAADAADKEMQGE